MLDCGRLCQMVFSRGSKSLINVQSQAFESEGVFRMPVLATLCVFDETVTPKAEHLLQQVQTLERRAIV